jgi:hypothetical protein
MSVLAFLSGISDLAELSDKSKILLVAYYLRNHGQAEFTRDEVVRAFKDGRLHLPANLTTRLSQLSKGKTGPLVRAGPGRYALSLEGGREVEDYLSSIGQVRVAATALEKLVGQISDDAQQRFLAEVVACVQVGAKRAAVVMMWLLTVDHLQAFVLKHKLADFNQALAKRSDCKGLTISQRDDFLEIRDEKTFIEILRSAGIVSNDVRKILDEKLGFRNTCAHPNQIVVPDSKVHATIEDLVYNVVLAFPL